MMNRFFTLLLAASCLTAVGQVTYPYNPDENGDGFISVVDLQGILAQFGQTSQIQTCRKGELCYFGASQNDQFTEGLGCGTIVAATISSGSYSTSKIHIESGGYVAGDVLHLIHSSGGGYSSTKAEFYTLIDEAWVLFETLFGTSNSDKASSVIFNGSHWESLNQD